MAKIRGEPNNFPEGRFVVASPSDEPNNARFARHPIAIPLAMTTTSAYSRLYGQVL